MFYIWKFERLCPNVLGLNFEFLNFDINTFINQLGTNFGHYEGANPSSYVTDS